MRTLLVLLVLMTLAAGCETAAKPADRGEAPPRQDDQRSSAPQDGSPAEPTGFTGEFSSVDALQRCKATRRAVVCASTISTQRVRLGRGAASYLGETAMGYPDAAPLEIGDQIRTASGIECMSSNRGIECARGGHGFVLGDETALILRGSAERRYEAAPQPPEPDPIPEPDFGEPEPIPQPDPGPVEAANDGCDPEYEGACIPLVLHDLDCPEIGEVDFYSVGSDPHGFDGDYDGLACESY